MPGVLASQFVKLRGSWKHASRYLKLRAQGYASANYGWRDYGRQRASQVRDTVREVFDRAGLPHFDVILEQGCGPRYRTTPGLREFANEIWGTDVLPREEILTDDRYILIDVNRPDCLHEVADNSVDAVLIINYTGMHPHSTWPMYFAEYNDRLWPYMQPQNFPRVLRPRGYLVCMEWEAEPEARWGKASLDEIDRRSDDSYKPPQLPGYELVASGFSRAGLCPFVVYRRT